MAALVPCAARAARRRGRRLGGRGGVRATRLAPRSPRSRRTARRCTRSSWPSARPRPPTGGEVFAGSQRRRRRQAAALQARRLRSLVPRRGAGGARPRRDPPQRRPRPPARCSRARRAPQPRRRRGHAARNGSTTAWERADAFAAEATGNGPALTNAELRVLRLPPEPPLVPRDRRAPARVDQHGQDAGAGRSIASSACPAAPTPSRAAARSGWSMADAASPPVTLQPDRVGLRHRPARPRPSRASSGWPRWARSPSRTPRWSPGRADAASLRRAARRAVRAGRPSGAASGACCSG